MKNPNGYGSIVKLGKRRKKPYAVRITAGWSAKGKQQYKYIGYYAKREDAMLALGSWNKLPVMSQNPTLEELYEEWSNSKYPKISKQTADCYRAAWRRVSIFANVKVKDIKTSHLQVIIDENSQEGREKIIKAKIPHRTDFEKMPALGKSSLEKIKALCTLLWDYAVQCDIVSKNYAQFVDIPHMETSEKQAFTEIELHKIEQAAADGVPYADCILIMCFTGWRISEFLELTKFNYNNKLKTLTGGKKTEAGKNRIVPLPDKIVPYVEKWIDKGGKTIFCRADGMPYDAKSFREDCFYPALNKIGVRKLTPHCTRHTYATLLYKSKVDSKTKQALLGHTSEAMTNHYTHLDAEDLKKAINLIDY